MVQSLGTENRRDTVGGGFNKERKTRIVKRVRKSLWMDFVFLQSRYRGVRKILFVFQGNNLDMKDRRSMVNSK